MTCLHVQQSGRQLLFGQNTVRYLQPQPAKFVGEQRHLRYVELQLFHALHLAEDLTGRPLHCDFTAIHNNDTVRVYGLLHVMRDQDDRDAFRAVQFHRRADDLSAPGGIQHSCGLIQDDTLGLHCNDAGDGYSLLLSA